MMPSTSPETSSTTSRSFAPRSTILLTELGDGTGVLLDLQTKFYFTLNATGLAVWKALVAGASSIAAVADAIAGEFDVDASVASKDVGELLSEMVAKGLVDSR